MSQTIILTPFQPGTRPKISNEFLVVQMVDRMTRAFYLEGAFYHPTTGEQMNDPIGYRNDEAIWNVCELLSDKYDC